MRVYVVIVIYNKECTHSIACNTLPMPENATVLVMDNSTKTNNNSQYCIQRQWKYISMNGNHGLSRAYNRALDELKGLDGHIVLLDDDTRICTDYFDKLNLHVDNHPGADIFLPIVMNGKDMLSPSRMGRFHSRQVDDFTVLAPENMTGINSGMAVNKRVYANYRYDERLFLDCIDHRFIRDMKHENRTLHVMRDVVLHQQFFGSQKNIPWADIRRRYLIFKKDFLYFSGKSLLAAMYARLYLFFRYGKLLLKFILKRP